MKLDAELLQRARMTQNQLVMWLSQKMAGRRPIYNMGMAIRIDAALDQALFRAAFEFVVRKSDNMRSVFRFVDGGPKCVILGADEIEFDFPFLDFSEDPDAVIAWMNDRIRQRLNLKTRLFDSALLRVGDDQYIWYICQHHLICDGWSYSNLVSRVGDRYAQLQAGDDSDIDYPQYRDFIERELEYYQSEECAQSERYWNEVAEDPLRTPLMYGLGRDQGVTDFLRVHRPIGSDVIGRMRSAIADKTFRAFSEDQGMTLLWLSALTLQLRRATGQDRIGIGVCLHNRLSPEEKKTLGTFFICSGMRVNFDPDQTFGELYKQVGAAYRKMLRNYRVPVAARDDECPWYATINYVNKTFPTFAGIPVTATWLHAGAYTPNAFVGIQIQRFNQADGMTAEWDFNQGIFGTEERRQTAMRDFEEAIEFGLANPNARLKDFA